jgi:zinc transport system substrate-binding protein
MRYIISLLLASTALPALAEVPQVVADIPPVHALVAQVMGDLGSPTLLLDRGASEHEFQLRPSQAALVEGADLIVWVGPELTPWLSRVTDSLGSGVPTLALLAAPGTALQDFAETEPDGHDKEHGDAAHDEHGHDEHGHEEHGHEEHGHWEEGHGEEGHAEEESGHEGHDHGGTDPHAWLDPANAQVWLGAIAAELSRVDPANAATYAANAASAVTGIDALDAEVAAILAPAQGRPIVVFHDAYGYFAGHYGLTIAAALAPGDATSPGAARLSAIQARLSDGTPVCAFPEPQHDPALLTQMAEATGARLGGAIDPVGSLLDPGPGAYAMLLKGMAQTIADCAGD